MLDALDLVIEVGNVAFLLALFLGLVEVAGVLGFRMWAFRLGRHVLVEAKPVVRRIACGGSGTTRFAAFKLLADGRCLFRRKAGFLNTAVEWKGIISWQGESAQITAIEPLGPLLSGGIIATVWLVYGVRLSLGGAVVPGLLISGVVLIVATLSARDVARTARRRFSTYLEEVSQALADGAGR